MTTHPGKRVSSTVTRLTDGYRGYRHTLTVRIDDTLYSSTLVHGAMPQEARAMATGLRAMYRKRLAYQARKADRIDRGEHEAGSP